MSESLKRAIFIGFFVLFTIIVGIAIWWVFFRIGAPLAPPTPPGEEVTGELPGAGGATPGEPTEELPPGALTGAGAVPGAAVTGAPEFAATVTLRDSVTQQVSPSPDGDGARFYDPTEAKFYRVTSDGRTVALSDTTFPNVESVAWGNSTDQAIIQFPDGSKVHYDFRTQKQTTLPKHWEGFDFSGDDTSVVAKSNAIAPESRFLVITDPDGSNPRAIESLGDNDGKVFPTWTPNNQIVAYATVGEATGFDRQSIIMVGQNNENFRGLVVEGRGFDPLWSPSGQTLLYSVWSLRTDYKPGLWFSGGAPGNMNEDRTELQIETWAEKCAWADEFTVYCGVPKTLTRGAGLQPGLFQNTDDVIYRIDLRSGEKLPIGEPEGDLTVSEPVVTEDGMNFIFKDASSGLLYSFRLQ